MKNISVQILQTHSIGERVGGKIVDTVRKVGEIIETTRADAESLHRKRFGRIVVKTEPAKKEPAKKVAKKKVAKKKAR